MQNTLKKLVPWLQSKNQQIYFFESEKSKIEKIDDIENRIRQAFIAILVIIWIRYLLDLII